MSYWYELDSDNDLIMDFDDLRKKAMELLETKKKLANMIQIIKDS